MKMNPTTRGQQTNSARFLGIGSETIKLPRTEATTFVPAQSTAGNPHGNAHMLSLPKGEAPAAIDTAGTVTRITRDITGRNANRSMNRSCVTCCASKRKCDGDGINPCSLCVGRKLTTCTYRMRRSRKADVSGKASTNAATTIRRTVDMSNSYSQLTRDVGALKRICRPSAWPTLSASPATGLVGVVENGLLTDLYQCMGLTLVFPQSVIREAMIFILSSPFHVGEDGRIQPDGTPVLSRAAKATARNSSPLGEIGRLGPISLATCMFWCAIAAGGVLQGQSMTSVKRYVDLAKEILACYVDEQSALAARAHISLAFLGGISGDEASYERYMCSAAAVNSLQDRGAQGERTCTLAAEMVNHLQSLAVFHRDFQDVADVKYLIRQDIPCYKLTDAMVLDGVLRYVMAFDIQFAHAFFADIYNNLHPPGNIANDEPRKIAEEAWVDGDLSSIDSFDGCDRSMSAIDGCENEIPSTVPTRGSSYGVDDRRDFDEIHESATECSSRWLNQRDGIIPLRATQELLDEIVPQRKKLLHLANRPEVRDGYVSLRIYAILALSRAALGDVKGAMETIPNCVEILLRYPGFLRMTLGVHGVHCLVTVLALMKSEVLYSRLQDTYNAMRAPGAPPIPPSEKWQGVGVFCRHIFCRVMEQHIKGGTDGLDSGAPPSFPSSTGSFRIAAQPITWH